VLDRVYEQMEDMLTEHDHQEVRSGELRWRNTACWERKRLVEEGLLRRDSPHGIWAISDQGRVWLARQNEAMQ